MVLFNVLVTIEKKEKNKWLRINNVVFVFYNIFQKFKWWLFIKNVFKIEIFKIYRNFKNYVLSTVDN